jgi:N utilization substance protein A
MTSSAQLLAALQELANVKQLDRTELLDLLRDGIHAALAKRYGVSVRDEISIDDLKGTITVTVLKSVVAEVEDPTSQVALEDARYEDPDFEVGDVLEEEVPFDAFGRLAVQAAKQRIIQRVREGERSRIREEFGDRVGELVSGEIQQIERGRLVVMVNRFREAEAIIPYREQNPRERFHQGDTIRGGRTKIAVISRDDGIDPVGACVGLKGSRVQAVVNELGGERIDIVPWSPDPERFAKLALAPARVTKVFADPDNQTIQAIVDEDQLSLAIGRNGQNVRLASELTGWKIDLYSSREWLERGGEGPLFAPLPPEEEFAVEVLLNELKGLPSAVVETLEGAGFKTLRDVLDLERDDALKIEGMSPERTEVLLAFLSELTEDNAESEAGESEGESAVTEASGDESAVSEVAEGESAVTEVPEDESAEAPPAA